MSISNVLVELKAELDRINGAIDALEGTSHSPNRHGRRRMSAEARAKIGRAMRLRWAERKKKTKVHQMRKAA